MSYHVLQGIINLMCLYFLGYVRIKLFVMWYAPWICTYLTCL